MIATINRISINMSECKADFANFMITLKIAEEVKHVHGIINKVPKTAFNS